MATGVHRVTDVRPGPPTTDPVYAGFEIPPELRGPAARTAPPVLDVPDGNDNSGAPSARSSGRSSTPSSDPSTTGSSGPDAPAERVAAASAPDGVRHGWSLLPLMLLAWCTGMAYLPVFEFATLTPVVTMAAVSPVVLSLAVSGLLRYPLWPATALSVLAAIFAASATLYRDRAIAGFIPSPSLAREMGGTLLDAPQTVLGTILPAPPEARLLVLVFATVWAVGFAGAELALRRDGRALPVLPAVLPLAAVPMLGIGGEGPTVRVTACAALAAGLVVMLRSPAGPERIRALVFGVPVALLLAVLAVVVSALLPGAARSAVDLRTHVDRPPPVTVDGINPLDRVSAWLREPRRPMFSVSAPGAASDQLWRLTVLDRYDGVSWLPVRELEPTGGRVPPPDMTSATRRLTQEVTLRNLPGPWLPAADRPSHVDIEGTAGGRITVDPLSGVLADEQEFTSGTRYTVVSDVPVHDPQRIQFALPANDPAHTDLPQVDASGAPLPAAEALQALARQATEGSTFPYQQALRLAQWLRDTCKFDVDAVPGHGLRNLQYFLETSKRGTSEQFAAAFAVMARSLGLPTRVAVGFRSQPPVDGVVNVRSGDVLAWAEVHFAGMGWVPFYPTPAAGPVADIMPPPESAQSEPVPGAARPAEPEEPSKAEMDARIRDAERDAAAHDPGRGGSAGPPWWVWAAAALGSLLAAVPVFVLGRPFLRRRARRRGPPERRIVGAWDQVEERLRRIGLPADEALTASDVAAFGERRLGAEPAAALAVLAALYNELVFAGPDERPDNAPVAALAWRCCREVESAVRAARPPVWRRVRLVSRPSGRGRARPSGRGPGTALRRPGPRPSARRVRTRARAGGDGRGQAPPAP